MKRTIAFYLRALAYFRPDAGPITLSLLLIGIMTAIGLLQAFPLAILLDSIIGKITPGNFLYRAFFAIAPQSAVGQIILLAALVLGLRLLQELLSMVQTLLNIRIGFAGLMRVRCDLFRKLQALSLAYHKSQPQGDAIYRLSYDTYGFQTILNTLVQTILVSAITLIVMTVIMLQFNWQLTLLALAVAPLLWWTTKIYARVLHKKATEAKEVESLLTTSIQRSVATIGLVQAFGREQDEFRAFEGSARLSAAAYLRLHWQEVLYWLFVGSIFGLGAAILFGYGGYLVYIDQVEKKIGDAGMTVGKLSIFLTYFMHQLYGPLAKLSGSFASIQGGVAGVQRVFEVMDRDPIIRDAPDAIPLPLAPRTVTLDDLRFAYRHDAPVLNGVSAVIPPGQMVAFVGSSGVGKTTLLNLLPRFYDPIAGAIRLDNFDLRKIKVRDVRRHIALVLQENPVLPASVADNIAYGRPEATRPQIEAAAKLAGAHDFITKLEHAYETQIAESGGNLSGGQKQRISIARALLTEAPVIVMDEPTSALDAGSEHLIIDTLRALKGTRTIILVSHRLSTVADCDQIFVMNAGKIIEQGTHESLITQRGEYYEMARHQMRLDDPA